MTTSTIPTSASAVARPLSYDRFAGMCAILAAITGLSYALAFVVFRNPMYAGLFLMLGGFLGSVVVTALYERTRTKEPAFAMWALLMGAAACFGAVIHGGFDLANALHPPAAPIGADVPNTVDPRGLLVFGVRAVWLVLFMWLAARWRALSPWTIRFGYASAGLSIALYLGRLIILDASNTAIVGPALVEGFFVNPVFLLLLGMDLRSERARA
jgi:hypothetical protein